MKTTRRTFLGGLVATSVPAFGVSAAEPEIQSIDAFLAEASPDERARYHAKALAEVMAEMHPDHSWRSEIDHKHHFVLTVGDPGKRKSARVAKVHIDDGPLLADDVTGTTAFANWEAGR
ncbi:hypothetical protein KYK29_04935 [Shinella daejeonensis]|uniref:hypothetical protein n=1 Tax=Shinella daejeonensis TaxID=659017 RepID=UPI0020C79C3D|nr:hypothetical protein [Shinella daejeonensis]MCP8894265.1 hypothetical protein [Shinella daejeonensis]